MVFVKRKKRESFDWNMLKHLTIIDVEQGERPTIEDKTIVRNALEIVDHVLRSSGVKKYKIVYFEDNSDTVPIHIDELADLFDKYPECLGGGLDEELECLEKKTGKKYVLLYIRNTLTSVVAEILG